MLPLPRRTGRVPVREIRVETGGALMTRRTGCVPRLETRHELFPFTGQSNWCGSVGYYGGQHGSKPRCPPEKPTWCICKWALADWIGGEGCGESVEIDCAGTDICATSQGLYFSYQDYGRTLSGAQECVAKKCPEVWKSCVEANKESTKDRLL